jgi:hypothetical protein
MSNGTEMAIADKPRDEKGLSEWSRKEVVYYDVLVKLLREHCTGQARAKSKEFLWDTVVGLWDPTITEFDRPTRSWFNSHHPRFKFYCAKELVLPVLYCARGIYIAQTKKEVRAYRKTYTTPYLKGVKRATNELEQSLVRNRFGLFDALKVMIGPLLYSNSSEVEVSESDSRAHILNAGPSLTRKLTPKQTRFAESVAGGERLVVAYRLAYNASNMDQASVRVEASRLAALPHVNATIEWLRAAHEKA